jgi:hypothetical protein
MVNSSPMGLSVASSGVGELVRSFDPRKAISSSGAVELAGPSALGRTGPSTCVSKVMTTAGSSGTGESIGSSTPGGTMTNSIGSEFPWTGASVGFSDSSSFCATAIGDPISSSVTVTSSSPREAVASSGAVEQAGSSTSR